MRKVRLTLERWTTTRLSRRLVVAALGLVTLTVAAAAVGTVVDGSALTTTLGAAGDDLGGVALATAAFVAAFVLRAVAWHRVLPSLGVGHALSGIGLSLAANHLLPLRLGEGARVASVVRRAGIPLRLALTSTVALRLADIAACAAIVVVASPRAAGRVFGSGGWPLAIVLVLACAIAAVWLPGARWGERVRALRPDALALTAAAWPLEAVVVWQVGRWTGIDYSGFDALVVGTAAVMAQVAAFAPAGLGTYEAGAAAAASVLGYDAALAFTTAFAAHAFKTVLSLAGGALAVPLPSPGLLGRFRLPRHREHRAVDRVPHPGPVVVFLPARNEAARVGGVLRRMPASVAGRRVVSLVVDDGSTDGTAAVARAAGAHVVIRAGRHGRHGLGAAVRDGLRAALEHDPSVVAFLDADGEYAPEDLERVVRPVLEGDADYVVGSRFAGTIRRMLPHRRVGNRLLTTVMRVITRHPITDGQSGYRALSPAAAEGAEIIHDFNYAQVLTLDLLTKGYRYAEVPITYSFRDSGRSFVRLPSYLRHVVPGVYRALNRPAAGPSILDDVRGEVGARATPAIAVDPVRV